MLKNARILNKAGDPRPLALWRNHLKWVTDHADPETERAGSLFINLGFHYKVIGDYNTARPYYKQALAIKKKVLGANSGEEWPIFSGKLGPKSWLNDTVGTAALGTTPKLDFWGDFAYIL